MEYRTIEELAYVIQQAKKAGQPQPIFFLGAGVSKTGGIPLANEIIKDILEKYKDSPFIKKLKDEDKNYVQLMNCLQAYERNELLKGYIDNAKINVTHIYLAQLLHSSYVDYILSVNFDNLMLRALSLYNEFPATYDMAILKDLTTSTIKEKSVVYLHGKHDGLWLLNTEDEMAKVGDILPRIFDSIKNKRPWVVIGYSASDPVFEHIKNLGRFDHDLYWVGYKDSEPNANVKSFLNTKNTNAYFIKGYDSDSFMLKLNEELGLDQPIIMDKPFSSLKNMLGEINDIDEDKHFKGVKDRLEIAKKNVDIAIQQFEKNKVVTIDPNELSIDKLKKEIIELTISEEYDIEKIKLIEEKLNKFNDNSINDSLSDLYFNWGNALGDLAEMKEGAEAESLFLESIDKYKRVID
ncbi:SIR2 family protein, partial [Flammeovirga sp. EKP202]|uniref:SIR2 family protein n=1 Tax=Flammeovirga sp. EKP202 TaxID=2770592 RepID=UPI00165EBF5E